MNTKLLEIQDYYMQVTMESVLVGLLFDMLNIWNSKKHLKINKIKKQWLMSEIDG